MLTIDPNRSLLLVVNFQSRLMPAIHEGEIAVRNANRLLETAKMFDIPRLFTEQNAKGLGATVEELPVENDRLVNKQFFDARRGKPLSREHSHRRAYLRRRMRGSRLRLTDSAWALRSDPEDLCGARRSWLAPSGR
jgi:nicotinamidase-related amidase